MPDGILIDYNDGRPVMAITAGLRAPSFAQRSRAGHPSSCSIRSIHHSSSQDHRLSLVPTNPIYIYSYAGFDVAIMTGVTRNGNSGVIIGAETIGGKALSQTGQATLWSCCQRRHITKDYWFQTRLTSPVISNQAALMTCARSDVALRLTAAPLPGGRYSFGKWDNPEMCRWGLDGGNIIVRDISTQDGTMGRNGDD